MLRQEDFEPYARISADPEVARYLGNGKPLDRYEAWRSLAAHLGHWALRGYGMFAVVDRATNAFIGRAGFFQPEGWPGFEIGWTIARESWGRGFATEAATRCLEYAFDTLAQPHVISVIQPGNLASIRVAEKIGESFERSFRLLGNEVSIYGVDRDTWRARLSTP